MKLTLVALPGLWLASLLASPAASILSPGDVIFGYDLDSNSSTPGSGNEEAFKAVDGDSFSKYLNFGKRHSGLIVTPGASVAQSFAITTGGDAVERDPTSYLIFGTNAAITTTDHQNGFADDWTLIGGGALSLPPERNATGAPVDFANSGSFSSYWMVFPTLNNEGTANSMQISELQFFTDLNGAGSSILSPGNPAVATSWNSDFPGGESASNLIDGTSSQKYLNFGKENSAFWVVPAMGPSIVQSFTLTTANDWPERDPASFRLLGQAADGSWNLIDAGPLSLTDDREVESAPIVVANSTAYNAYRMEFDSLKNGAATNSMQIGEVQFFDVVPEPSTSFLAAGGLLGLLIRRRRH